MIFKFCVFVWQGVDPATDFRGVGILGLLQPLAASLSVETLPLMSNIVNLSHNPSQGFPFMVLSLNVSNIVLKALREGILDKYVCFLQNCYQPNEINISFIYFL